MNQKLANTKSYSRRLQKEIENYRGSTQRLATSVQSDLPVYAARIDRMASTLQAYVELSTEDVSAAVLVSPKSVLTKQRTRLPRSARSCR